MTSVTRLVWFDGQEPARCLGCNEKMDAATGVNGECPGPGDIAVCKYCAHVQRYGEDMRFVEITEEEWDSMDADERALLEALTTELRFRRN